MPRIRRVWAGRVACLVMGLTGLVVPAVAQEPAAQEPAAAEPAAQAAAAEDAAADPTRAEWTLDNGLTVSVLVAPDAPLQHTVTFLPHGLIDDGPGHTQWSHLVEHLILRHTDPEGLFGEGYELNGETTTRSTHLDTYAEPHAWRTTLERHAAWLQPFEVDAPLLAREQEAVTQEVLALAAVGSTHKWADAAWAQVVRFGAEHVEVVGAVAGCTPSQATAALAGITGVRPGTHVAIVGAMPLEEVRVAVEEVFGPLPAAKPVPAPAASGAAAADAAAVGAPGDRHATWDLPQRHYVAWYALPDGDVVDRAAGEVLAARVNGRLALATAIRKPGLFALAGADLITPEGRFLRVTVGLPGEVELEPVADAIDDAVRDVLQPGIGVQPLGVFLWQWAVGAAGDPEPGALRRDRERAGRADDRLEAQFAISPMYRQLGSDMTREQRLDGLRGLDLERLEAIASEFLVKTRRASLLLAPRD